MQSCLSDGQKGGVVQSRCLFRKVGRVVDEQMVDQCVMMMLMSCIEDVRMFTLGSQNVTAKVDALVHWA